MNPILQLLIIEDECIFALDLKFKLIELGCEVTGTATNRLPILLP